MSVEQITCNKLHCDVKISDECEETFSDPDTDGVVHGSTPEEIRRWAHAETSGGGYSWWISPAGDACGACRREIGKRDHDFAPSSPGSSVCAYCEEWATEGRRDRHCGPGGTPRAVDCLGSPRPHDQGDQRCLS